MKGGIARTSAIKPNIVPNAVNIAPRVSDNLSWTSTIQKVVAPMKDRRARIQATMIIMDSQRGLFWGWWDWDASCADCCAPMLRTSSSLKKENTYCLAMAQLYMIE